MSRAKLRLAVASGLFLAWIGYLAYLVSITRDPVILSRPQLLTSNLLVIAKIEGDENRPSDRHEALVQEVPWSADPADTSRLVGKTISVIKLEKTDWTNGWQGPGLYILPLTKSNDQHILLTATPPSPGFVQPRDEHMTRIYLATPDARRQLADFVALKK